MCNLAFTEVSVDVTFVHELHAEHRTSDSRGHASNLALLENRHATPLPKCKDEDRGLMRLLTNTRCLITGIAQIHLYFSKLLATLPIIHFKTERGLNVFHAKMKVPHQMNSQTPPVHEMSAYCCCRSKHQGSDHCC